MRISDWSSDVCSSDLEDQRDGDGADDDIHQIGIAGPLDHQLDVEDPVIETDQERGDAQGGEQRQPALALRYRVGDDSEQQEQEEAAMDRAERKGAGEGTGVEVREERGGRRNKQ